MHGWLLVIKMDGWNVDETEQKNGKRETEEVIHVHPQHRRSKSASERLLDVPRNGVVHSRKEQKETPASTPSARAYVVRNPRSPLHDPFSNGRNRTRSQRASLENDIEQLQSRLQQEKSMRATLEKAMGRTSSTLSPGHRHVAAKTKELIAEIELLEEEVANREQHVLSLYRSIFEQCVSQPSSNQSSSVASPAHTKQATRKHPSIISSAFCSSKKFPLRPLQSLVSMDDARKRTSRSSQSLPSTAKTEVHFDNTCSNTTKALVKESPSRLRTLKDHLYQCPSKLSEEMVRYMAAVYCWLRSTTSIDHVKSKSCSMSKSSTNAILPRRGTKEDHFCSSKSMVEISWISTDKGQFSRASYAINNYRLLVEQLERVNISQMEDDAKIAFWINVYNSLVMHAYLAYGIPSSSLRRLALFHKAAYNIGGHIISASAIEQSIFGFRTPRIGRWLETIVSAALRKRSGEERQIISSKYGLQSCPSLVCFAICTGAISDPVLKVYTALNLREELEAAKRGFLQANVVVQKSKVILPKVLDRFSREASISMDDLLSWVVGNVDKKLHDTIQKCIERKSNKKASQIIEWLPYSSRFQYVFSKDLMEKPWWY